MDDELISKKELLELTGISYGQLYRWKRKNIVPEEWFIHKSAYTGQETFFPRQLVLARIDKILQMKDDLSLDALADVFSSVPADISIETEKLREHNIVSKTALEYAKQHLSPQPVYSFEQTLFLFMLEHGLQTGEMSLDEGQSMMKVLADHYANFSGKACELILIRKMGISVFLLMSAASEIYSEDTVKVVLKINVGKCIEELKHKLITL